MRQVHTRPRAARFIQCWIITRQSRNKIFMDTLRCAWIGTCQSGSATHKSAHICGLFLCSCNTVRPPVIVNSANCTEADLTVTSEVPPAEIPASIQQEFDELARKLSASHGKKVQRYRSLTQQPSHGLLTAWQGLAVTADMIYDDR